MFINEPKSNSSPPKLRQLIIAIVAVLFAVLFMAGINLLSYTQPKNTFVDQVAYLIEDQQALEIDAVKSLSNSQWQEVSLSDFNAGISDKTYWFKATLPELKNDQTWWLEIGYPLLDDITIWVKDGDTISEPIRAGDGLPFAKRPINHHQFLFPIAGSDNSQRTLFLRIATSSAFKLPLSIWRTDDYMVHSSEFNLILGLFFGVLVAMGFNSLFFWAATGSKTFLSYAGYVLSMAICLFANYGYGFKFIWPNSPYLQSSNVLLFGFSTIYFGVIFTYTYLELKFLHNAVSRYVKYVSWLVLAMFPLCFAIPYQLMLKLLIIVLLAVAVSCLGLGLWCLKQRNPFAKVYVLAWSVVLIAGMFYAMAQVGLIKFPGDAHMILVLASTIENIIFSFALALNYHQQREASQEQQRKAQSSLTSQVEERTWELEIALRELAESNRQLEKLSMIDALTDCHNRRYFDKKHIAEIRRSRRLQTPLCLAMIDLDYFKNINDNHGHMAGDACLKQVAKLLQSQLRRDTDMLFRYGGEEFTILLPSTDTAGSFVLLNKIRKAVENHNFTFEDKQLNLTVSIGFCCDVISQETPETGLLAVADQALYFAKRQGRNTIIEQPLKSNSTTLGDPLHDR